MSCCTSVISRYPTTRTFSKLVSEDDRTLSITCCVNMGVSSARTSRHIASTKIWNSDLRRPEIESQNERIPGPGDGAFCEKDGDGHASSATPVNLAENSAIGTRLFPVA